MEQIFARLRARMLEGMVFHDEMARYWDFLDLQKFRESHERHYVEESVGYREVSRYYMEHHNKFIPVEPMSRPDVIPQSWYQAKRQDVDKGTKQSGIKSGIEKWVAWETETKAIYQDAYLSLIEIGEPAAASFVLRFVEDVDEELKCAMHKHLALEAAGYDLGHVMSCQ